MWLSQNEQASYTWHAVTSFHVAWCANSLTVGEAIPAHQVHGHQGHQVPCDHASQWKKQLPWNLLQCLGSCLEQQNMQGHCHAGTQKTACRVLGLESQEQLHMRWLQTRPQVTKGQYHSAMNQCVMQSHSQEQMPYAAQ